MLFSIKNPPPVRRKAYTASLLHHITVRLHVSTTYPAYTASRTAPCHLRNRDEIIAGITAIHPTKKQAGRSKAAEFADTGSSLPDINELKGRISDRSRILAPRIFPTERSDCLLAIAVSVVTSSGKDVPTAMTVTPIMRSDTPAYRARVLSFSTGSCAPITIPIYPAANFRMFCTISLF